MSSTPKKVVLAEKTPQPNIIPFPLMRCRDLVRETARGMLPSGQVRGSRDRTRAQRTLAAALEKQRETMEKRGIVPKRIATELAAFERAARCEHARLLNQKGRA